MHKFLAEDHAQLDKILENIVSEANRFLSKVDTLPAGTISPSNIAEIKQS